MHTGVSPCRNCAKKGAAEVDVCTLSEPELKQRVTKRSSSIVDRPARKFTTQSETPRRQKNSIRDVLANQIPAEHSELVHTNNDSNNVFSGTDANSVISVLAIFHQKFPELRFLHLPSLTRHLRQVWSSSDSNGDRHSARHGAREKLRLLCAAVMALCSGGDKSDKYADYVRDRMAVSLFATPDLLTVQTLLVLTMYEWGMGQGYRAWMYAGAAARMMQSLLVLWRPSSSTCNSIEQEERNRTFWGCFIMDRMVFCGQPHPFVLSMCSSNVRWPAGEQDFIFGETKTAEERRDDGATWENDLLPSNIDHYYGLLVRGFDIWARVLQFVVNGGRRQPGLCRPENHPWVAGSPWRLPHDELQMWRKNTDKRLRYPETAVAGHAALGNGNAEQFAYINLIYYISILFLGREYIPFLPTPDAGPVGPVDPPLLSLPPPPTWWADRAAELFLACVRIVTLLRELDDAGAALDSPFAGFCSFSAATMNLYVLHFPNMNLGRSTDMPTIVADNLRFLENFQARRPMGRGWWVTIQHCQALYAHANQDRTLFAGRTRADFEALEYSIHDVRGQPPKEGASLSPASVITPVVLRPLLSPQTHGEMILPSFQAGFVQGLQPASPADTTTTHLPSEVQDLSHNQVWPLWGEQQTLPFALEGLPLDYNLDMMDIYQT